MRRVYTFATSLLGIGLIASSAFAQTPPPVAAVRPVTDDYFGTKVVDNYRYFENLKDPEVQQWMKAQAEYTDTVLARIPGRAAFLARLRELDASDKVWISDVWRLPGDRYFYLERSGKESDLRLYQRAGLAGAERLLVDPGTITLAPQDRGKGPSSIEGVSISENGRYVAVGITPGGAERDCELHLIDVATGRETGDVVLRVAGCTASWLPGDTAFLYDRFQDLPAGAPASEAEQKQRTYLHRIGTTTQEDRAVFGYDVVSAIHVDPAQFADARAGSRSAYAIGLVGDGISPNEAIYIAPVQSIGSAAAPWQLVAAFSDDVTDAAVHGNDLYLLTFKGASHYKIVRTDARHPDLATAETVVPESGAILQNMSRADDALYVGLLDGGILRVLRVPWGPHPDAAYLPVPFPGSISVSTDAGVSGALVYPGSPVRIGFIGSYDPVTKRISDTRLQPEGPYDNPSTIATAEVKVSSYDGTLVPLTIVYPKGMKLDGSHPALLTGYGAYGYPAGLYFIPTSLAAYERGAVQATCHVRGGGDFGEDWHLAGKKLTKPNTWKDFIACAQYLVTKGYTSPARLAGEGASAGGILIGRAIEERPDLFAAAIADVPAADMLRQETTANGVPNISEFGSTKTEDGFRGLYAMSPYANVQDGVKYPAVLVTTGINDPRVDPWEPAKFAARLEAATASGKPVLLRVDYHAGHGVTSSNDQRLQADADMWSFILWQTGDPNFQPHEP